jgi:hypothetical protein
LLTAMLAAIGIAVVIIVIAVVTHDGTKHDLTSDPTSSISIANSFPVPADAKQAFPDNVTEDVATKGWTTTGTLEHACATWRNAYRGWVDQGQAGSITGEDQDGRRCTLSGPKAGHTADLSVTVYGTDATPQVTLTVKTATP